MGTIMIMVGALSFACGPPAARDESSVTEPAATGEPPNARDEARGERSGVVHRLPATPATVAWGYYWSEAEPVLRVRSGDSVDVETLITSSPARLERGGVAPADVQQSLRDVYDQVTAKGPGGHILTGPIYIEGAEPGDGR